MTAVVSIVKHAGVFAEDKDAAAEIRKTVVLPAVGRNELVTLDFADVRVVTQSFIHALISQALRQGGEAALDVMVFKNCSPFVRGIIETVVQYTLDSQDMSREDSQ